MSSVPDCFAHAAMVAQAAADVLSAYIQVERCAPSYFHRHEKMFIYSLLAALIGPSIQALRTSIRWNLKVKNIGEFVRNNII
jgi:hypothetical protein